VILQDEAEARADTRDIVTRDDIKRLEKNLLKKKEREKAEVFFLHFFLFRVLGRTWLRIFEMRPLTYVLLLFSILRQLCRLKHVTEGRCRPLKRKNQTSQRPAQAKRKKRNLAHTQRPRDVFFEWLQRAERRKDARKCRM